MPIYRYLRNHRILLVIIFAISIGGQVCENIGYIYQGNALQSIIKLDLNAFIRFGLTEVVLMLIYFVSSGANSIVQSGLKQVMDNEIRNDISAKMESISFEKFHSNNSSVYTSWLTNDINQINSSGFSAFFTNMSSVVMIVVSAATLATVSYTYLVTLIIGGLLIYFAPFFFKKIQQRSSERVASTNSEFTSVVNDSFEGFNSLYSLNALHIIGQRIIASAQNVKKVNVRNSIIGGSVNLAINLVSLFCQLAILGQTGWLVYQHQVNVGALFSSITVASGVFNGLIMLSYNSSTIRGVLPIFTKFDQFISNQSGHELTTLPSDNTVKIENLTYHYPNGTEHILNQFTYTFQSGGKYAVIGESGRGKSTLLNILTGRLTGYEGSVMIGGIEYRTIDPLTLTKKIVYLDQDPYIFDDTLRFNLTIGREISDEMLMEVLKETQLESWLAGLSEGLNTKLTQHGDNLSGGQRQRIALARGLLGHPAILLLDEGTSALNPVMANAIEQMLIHRKEMTLIMITHHLRPELAETLDDVVAL
ncbi:ABC transporter ATP-binding protein [Lapidilactobacillus mulanensis]|uniref:ABC transporter ATP-binding protein n=1 Tax=Lapidilactobacillus mulanensis TaxID=2485999 RepID=A0ABW4DM49_9LACO|nr:ABC transporter ATP-binding protein [Lapidilactobacillus mulanensis]